MPDRFRLPVTPVAAARARADQARHNFRLAAMLCGGLSAGTVALGALADNWAAAFVFAVAALISCAAIDHTRARAQEADSAYAAACATALARTPRPPDHRP